MRPLFASRDPRTADLARRLARVAGADLAVLLEGETGSGKSFIAARIHRRSRRGGPLVVVDCASLPTSLLPAELFGHAGGAFTDAGAARAGWLERAGTGTLVLDRVDALEPEGQAALLRVMEERLFVPLGASTPRRFGARVVATADQGLAARLEDRSFRRDLYHRLAGLHAVVPPLRERPDDIVPLAERLLAGHAARGGTPLRLTDEARDVLLAYPWPGNIRELDTVLVRAALQAAGDVLDAGHLDVTGTGWTPVERWCGESRRPLREVSRLYALWVLGAEGGNVSRAARVLGVSRRTLIRWRDGSRE